MRLLSFLRVRVALLAALAAFAVPSVRSQTSTPSIEIDANAAPHPFPHFWEKMFGSGRAILSLRRKGLKSVTLFIHVANAFGGPPRVPRA